MFARVLVANRGEIAARIMQTCAEMGIRTIAVYSEADAGALHLRRADESYAIGPAPAAESYLCIERIVGAALRSGAEAIHPGYGFLAENPRFAEACLATGLAFVGPPPDAMRRLGSKEAARALAQAVGVPVVPGDDGADQRPAALAEAARRVGFPLLIKATAGGGGRGMRIVRGEEEFAAALESAQREAAAAFGDARVLLERYIPSAHHVEFQILADDFGNVIHLGERECSVQRRRQKLIEESPSPSLTPALRAEIGAAAVAVARAADYRNAGTVEFLLAPGGDYYFLEVNTRLQVEHPVTELVTGLDLVREQLRIAAGQPLALRQDEVQAHGHAIECRITAEDVAAGFLPSTGPLLAFAPPSGAGIRNDVGVATGDAVSPFYDSLLAKLIIHAPDRDACNERALGALRDYAVLGVATDVSLLRTVLATPAFRAGTLTTEYLDVHLAELIGNAPLPERALLAAACRRLVQEHAGRDPWRASGAWRAGGERTLRFLHGKHEIAIEARRQPDGSWHVRLPDGEHHLTVLRAVPQLVVREGSATWCAYVAERGGALLVSVDGAAYTLHAPHAARLDAGGEGGVVHAQRGSLQAPMPGVIVAVYAGEGERVRAGQPVLALEAMKMEHIVAAPADGVVARLRYGLGDRVEAGAILVELEG